MICPCCMEEHAVRIVRVNETGIYKGVSVTYRAEYHYCEKADEFYADEREITENYAAMKTAYLSVQNR